MPPVPWGQHPAPARCNARASIPQLLSSIPGLPLGCTVRALHGSVLRGAAVREAAGEARPRGVLQRAQGGQTGVWSAPAGEPSAAVSAGVWENSEAAV